MASKRTGSSWCRNCLSQCPFTSEFPIFIGNPGISTIHLARKKLHSSFADGRTLDADGLGVTRAFMLRGGRSGPNEKRKRTKTRAEYEAELQVARAEVEARRKEESKSLIAIVRRWGCAGWALQSPGPLWQIQVRHIALQRGAFKDGLIDAARRALAHHPAYPRIKDFKTLIKEAKVKILNGAPSPSQSNSDPDKVDMVDWEPVLYVAGDVPLEGLTVIELVMEEKVRAGLLPTLPSFTLLWALAPGEAPPEVELPLRWAGAEVAVPQHVPPSDIRLSSPFSVLPPSGRRHLLAHLQPAAKHGACGVRLYDLIFFGGTYFFRKDLGDLKVPVQKMELPRTGNQDFAYLLYGFESGDAIKAHVQQILTEAFCSVPLLLTIGIEDKEDPFAGWLVEQPSVFLELSLEALAAQREGAREAAVHQLGQPSEANV